MSERETLKEFLTRNPLYRTYPGMLIEEYHKRSVEGMMAYVDDQMARVHALSKANGDKDE